MALDETWRKLEELSIKKKKNANIKRNVKDGIPKQVLREEIDPRNPMQFKDLLDPLLFFLPPNCLTIC